jgi:hypothetical protein
MIYPKTKSDIVKLVLNEVKDDPDFPWKDKSVDQLVFQWFMTGRSGSKNVRGEVNWGKYTVILDKKVNCPYYVGINVVDNGKKQPYIRIYDHKIAMMMTLYGDFQSYLDSVK